MYHKNKVWKNKNSDNCFDVTMGNNDRAEVCKLVGTLALLTLANSIRKENYGLYRDDGVTLMRNEKGQKRTESEKR